MPRTEVYQLRLHKREKDELALRAKEQGISIAKLIRQRLDLDAGGGHCVVSSTPIKSIEVEYAATFDQRVAELSRTMPKSNAERLARRELR